jgi:hypothetical protein
MMEFAVRQMSEIFNCSQTNLCFNGTASILTGTGPWDWTCSVLGEFEDPTINGSFDGTMDSGWSTSGGASTRIVK